jgi:hypothetical protein
MPEGIRQAGDPVRRPLKWRLKCRLAALAVVFAALAPPAAACIPGGAVRCAPPGTLDPFARIGPMTRQDIDALTRMPGPPVTEAVRRDTARTWDTVRRQTLPRHGDDPLSPAAVGKTGGAR